MISYQMPAAAQLGVYALTCSRNALKAVPHFTCYVANTHRPAPVQYSIYLILSAKAGEIPFIFWYRASGVEVPD